MACSEFQLDAGVALVRRYARQAQAVAQIVTDASNITKMPSDLTQAGADVAAAAGQIGGNPPTDLTYQTVDSYLSEATCPLAPDVTLTWPATQPGNPPFPDVGDPIEGKIEDVVLRLHFARQSFALATYTKWWAFMDALRKTDSWFTIRYVLSMFGALQRIGYTRDVQGEAVHLAGLLIGAQPAAALVVADFNKANGNVGDIPVWYVPSGMGVVEGVLTAIEQVYVVINKAALAMSDRLPFVIPGNDPPQFAAVRHACITCPGCDPVASGSAGSGGLTMGVQVGLFQGKVGGPPGWAHA